MRCPVTRNGEHVTLGINTFYFGLTTLYCAPEGKKLTHCVCYKSKADLAKSMSCPIKISLVKNDNQETKDAPVSVTTAKQEPVVNCDNNFTSEQPPENSSATGSDVFASFLIVLNAIQFAAILILVFIFRYKLEMQKRLSNCATDVKTNAINVDYEPPRQFAKEPEPIDTDEQPEFIMYEDAQVYLQESACYASASHRTPIPIKTQSSANGSEYYDFGKREDSESCNSIRVGGIQYY